MRLIVALCCCLGAWSAQAQSVPSDTIRIASLTGYPAARFFPNTSWDWGSATIAPLQFDALTEVEEGGEIVPALATAWRAEHERLWVFDLRKGIRFSNGEPFTSDAVIAAIAYLKTDDGRTLLTSGQVANIERVEVRGDHQVAIHTKEPDALLPARMRVIHMLPPRYFAELGRLKFIATPVGTGPFMADTLSDARSAFVANPYAWRPARVPKLVWLQVPDGVARVQAILSDAVDIAFNVGPGAAPVIADTGARVDAVRTAGVDTMPFVTTNDSPVQDRRVRLAINYAVNKAQIAQTLLDGQTQPATQFAPPGVFGYDAALPQPFPFDPDRARALLAEAGYSDGLNLAIELYVDSTEKAALVQQIANDLSGVGITLDILTSTVLDIQQRGLYGGDWEGDMINLPYFGLPSFDALAVFNVHSCLWSTPFHCDVSLTEGVLQARSAFDREDRLAKTRSLHRRLIEDPPALLLFDSVRYFVIGPRVEGYRAPFGIIRFHELGLLGRP